jgi:hypothetical protein
VVTSTRLTLTPTLTPDPSPFQGGGSNKLATILKWALALRVVSAVVLHLLSTDSLFAPDQQTYDAFAGWLARYWSGDTLVYPWKLLERGPKAYYYIVAALYYVFGAWPIVPKLLNAAVGAFSVRLAYDVALGMTGNAAIALRTAAYTAFFPSLVLWSVLNIRDGWVVMLILLICREAMALQEGLRLRPVLLLAAAVLVVMQFREYIFFAVAAPAVVSFLVRNRAHVGRNVALGMLLAAVTIYADRAHDADRRFRTLDLETMQELRQGAAVGGSRFEPGADISTPAKALAFLPTGLAFFLLAPFPWTVSSLRQVLTLPEMLFFYSLLPAMARGIAILVRHHLARSMMVLLITAGLTFGYSLAEANAGMAYRHRAQVLVFFLAFAAVGVESRRERRVPALEGPAEPAPAPA